MLKGDGFKTWVTLGEKYRQGVVPPGAPRALSADDKNAAVFLDSRVCVPLTPAHFEALDRLLSHRKIAVVFVDCRPTLEDTEKRLKGCVGERERAVRDCEFLRQCLTRIT